MAQFIEEWEKRWEEMAGGHDNGDNIILLAERECPSIDGTFIQAIKNSDGGPEIMWHDERGD